ncbi:DUF502 domain-containing protein [Chryseobacterium sp. MFBS3-17]|uniref:DUF502 domain-containing protein n=1 Tax=Chryseobacterium sp. MFBS3-17 TaxID=2886689 RepID=UPI001D0F1C1B|nr:DUF502 domain-containing protein [Chryseobacterium sp. MFBS3-17]MCC2591200.1 DUF502 domain-containing protein [Chryseobacterium sp. MFBS3-17]
MKRIQTETVLNVLLKSFFQGLMIVGPFGLTIFFIWYIVSSVDNLYPAISAKYPGVVFLSVISIITLLGFLGNKFIVGRFLLDRMDTLLESTPGIKHIYTPTKDVMSSFVGDKKKFNRPVWVKTNENPVVWRIGFLTQEDMTDVDKQDFVAVYLPHSYAISGWVIVTDEKNVKPVVGMSAAAAMKFAVSGGVAGFHSDKNVFKAPE